MEDDIDMSKCAISETDSEQIKRKQMRENALNAAVARMPKVIDDSVIVTTKYPVVATISHTDMKTGIEKKYGVDRNTQKLCVTVDGLVGSLADESNAIPDVPVLTETGRLLHLFIPLCEAEHEKQLKQAIKRLPGKDPRSVF